MVPMCFQSTYGMEVTKRSPFVVTHQRPRYMHHYGSPVSSYIWHELRSVFSYNMEKVSQFGKLGGTSTSLVPAGKVCNVTEVRNVHGLPWDVFRNNTSKSNLECLRLPVLPEPCRSAKSNKLSSILNTSVVREISQKLWNIFQIQRICCLVNEIAASCETYLIENICDIPMMSGGPGLESTRQVPKGSGGTSLEKSTVSSTKISVGPQFCESITKAEVVHHSSTCVVDDNSVVISYCSTAVEMSCGMTNRLEDVDKEMVSRKQRQIKKHSKKRKRRMKKKSKSPSVYPPKERCTSSKNVSHNKPNQTKRSSDQLLSSSAAAKSRTVLDDWEDSDEDFCIVFEHEIDCGRTGFPENLNSQCTEVGEIPDLWIEFDSFTLVDSSDIAVGSKSHTSEFVIQCDSDSECEADFGQIVHEDEFDSWSGLVFLSDTAVGCSGLQSDIYNPSFIPRTSLSEPAPVSDYVGSYEIRKINKRWKKMTSDVVEGPRLPQRVTFAPEEDLVAVFPVDMIDRKSEWEQFAVERFRFKKRVDEFEKIINPYFAPVHREKVCQRMRAADS